MAIDLNARRIAVRLPFSLSLSRIHSSYYYNDTHIVKAERNIVREVTTRTGDDNAVMLTISSNSSFANRKQTAHVISDHTEGDARSISNTHLNRTLPFVPIGMFCLLRWWMRIERTHFSTSLTVLTLMLLSNELTVTTIVMVPVHCDSSSTDKIAVDINNWGDDTTNSISLLSQ